MIICGPGNNGGDGLALARMLLVDGYKVKTYVIASEKKSDDFLKNNDRLLKYADINILKIGNEFAETIDENSIIVDAIFGSGLDREISGLYQQVVENINSENVIKVAIDIPSGVFCDSKNNDDTYIRSDYTLTFQHPKMALLMADNEDAIGQWEVFRYWAS